MHKQFNQTGSMGSFSGYGYWPNLYLRSYLEDRNVLHRQLSIKSMMSLYFSLGGMFWFTAKVYKGLRIHNALVNYDSQSNTFQARYQSGGWRCLGRNIEWDRVRRALLDDLSPYIVHFCWFTQLETWRSYWIQWRPNTLCPYDWCYAVIGHLDSCNEEDCWQCKNSDTFVVKFRQYPEASNMRRIELWRKEKEEQGDQIRRYYGAIRKLKNEDEIETWKKLFQHQVQSNESN